MGHLLQVGQLIDGTGNAPQSAVELLVEEGRVVDIGPLHSHDPAGHVVEERLHQTLVPGFIDLHTHFLYLTDGEFQKSELRLNRAAMMLKGFETARQWLEQGVTTARDVGTPFDLDFDLKWLIEKRPLMGPRMSVAGRMMTMTGGRRTPWDYLKEEVSGADEARRWTRTHLKNGADLVKLYCTTLLEEDVATYLADVLALPEGAPDPGRWASLTVDEIGAVAEEAHKAGCTVAAHVAPAFGIKLALRGGVDTIEHGSELDEECIELFLDTGATLVPTLSISHHQIAHSDELGLPDVYTRFSEQRWEHIKEWTGRAYEAGVFIATGTDPVLSGMDYLTEIELLVECGLPPLAALHSATGRAAAAMGNAGRFVGTLEPGKWADMVLLDADPLKDIHNVRSIAAVYKAGQSIHGPA
jgi:imidazolonepropionase-like amidohydrolase